MNSPREVPSLQGIVLVGLGALLLSAPAPAAAVHVAQPAGEVGLALRGQGPAGVALHSGPDRCDLVPVDVAGERMQAVTLGGTLLPNDAGAPDLPALGRHVAVPRGAEAPLVALPMGPEADRAPFCPEDDLGEAFGLAGTPTTWTRGVQSLRFTLIEPARVELTLYGVTGRRVATLVDGWHPAGSHTVRYDTTVSPRGSTYAVCRRETRARRASSCWCIEAFRRW